jgi:CRISPR-associated exonuclease Cas4
MNIIATHINYYHICRRKLWLFARGITMEQTSDTVYEGKLIGENTYLQRSDKYSEIEVSASLTHSANHSFSDSANHSFSDSANHSFSISLSAKIDFYDAKAKVVHETKKSDKMEQAHIAQVKFYLYVLEKNGVESPTGVLEYPKLRQTQVISALTPDDKAEVEGWIRDTAKILMQEECPDRIKKSFCKMCSYFEFCWTEEGSEWVNE